MRRDRVGAAAANAAAAARTARLLSAGGDEVSAATAAVFSAHGVQYPGDQRSTMAQFTANSPKH
ncbi:PE family protein [Mycobacterium ulcerans str. Harvey]|uniref:PE family protein n=1 Tax=Mycobacterium ulcerans str. Harvey TaxID=1299332 RepID=A0ABP3AS84_MYCUL|nr:PE family protein [Mycobacterium ulcerans str. Harvey]